MRAAPEREPGEQARVETDLALTAEGESEASRVLPHSTVAYRPGMTLEDMELEVIRAVLDSVDWNRRRAAGILGIGERTLYRKVRKYGLDQETR